MSPNGPVNTLIVHCSATTKGWGYKGQSAVDEIRRWHTQDRGWSDIAYHYIIDRDGAVFTGRDEDVMGAHAHGHNKGSIGICLIGGYGSQADDRFADHFTEQQAASLTSLINTLKGKHPVKRVIGHNQVSSKACPGFNVPRWLGVGTDKPGNTQQVVKGIKAAPIGAGLVGAIHEVAKLDPLAQVLVVVCIAILGVVGAVAYSKGKLPWLGL